MAVTPVPGNVSKVTTGGIAVIAALANPNGGYIQNPVEATESLFVDPVGAAATAAGGTTFELLPGGIWNLIPGQTTQTSCNSVDDNHNFSIVVF